MNLLEINWDELLEVYTVEEILELGGLTPAKALQLLHEDGQLDLPEVIPL